jgi:hypothetical protein
VDAALRCIGLVVIVVFLAAVMASPSGTHHARLILVEESLEIFGSFEDVRLDDQIYFALAPACDKHIFHFVRSYQNPALEILKQPPRQLV